MFATLSPQQDWDWQRAVPASLGLHLLVLGVLVAWPVARVLSPPPPRSIAVDIVSEAQFAAATRPKSPPSAQPMATRTEPAGPAEGPIPQADGPAEAEAAPFSQTVHATNLYSSRVLKDPANRQVRAALPTLAPEERMTQLCNIEALEQLRLARPEPFPDALVAPAFAETIVSRDTLTASGAAFRGGHAWFKAQYTCTVAANLESVTAFDFAIGPEIPEAEWDSHGLNAADSDE